MSETEIFMILEIIFFGLLISAEIPIIKSYIEDKNPVSIALIVYIASVQYITISKLLFLLAPSLDIVLGSGLRLAFLFGLIALGIQIEFLFYLKKLRKLYSIPVIITYYIGYGLIINADETPFIIFASVAGIVTMIILVREGKIHKNGIAIGLGLFGFIYGLSEMTSNLPMQSMIRIISSIILILGTSGFFGKYFTIQDKVAQQKITNVWISRKVQIKK